MTTSDNIEALRQLLEFSDARKYYHNAGYLRHHQNPCWISKPPQKISYTQYGDEYCFVEATCPDGSQYGIQAFGDEAIALYTKANRCILWQFRTIAGRLRCACRCCREKPPRSRAFGVSSLGIEREAARGEGVTRQDVSTAVRLQVGNDLGAIFG